MTYPSHPESRPGPATPSRGVGHRARRSRAPEGIALLTGLILAMGPGAFPAHAQQGSIAGTVVAQGTDQPIADARIAVPGGRGATPTRRGGSASAAERRRPT